MPDTNLTMRLHHAAYNRQRRHLIKTGQWTYRTAASTVQHHINTLRQHGMTLTAIAHHAGVPTATLKDILSRNPDHWVHGHTATRILNTPPTAPTEKPRANHIDSLGTRRRIQALVAYGYPLAHIATHLGRNTQPIWEISTGKYPTVTTTTAQLVAELYDRLTATPPPPPSPAANRARNQARRKGWAPPHMWDDGQLDHPEGQPSRTTEPDPTLVDDQAINRTLAGDHHAAATLNHAERAALVAIALARGWTLTALSRLLHASHTTIKQLAAKETQ